jgi:exoribonuclease R
MRYKIHIEDRNYKDYSFYDVLNMKKIDLNIDPIKEKLFTNDIFIIEDNKINIIYSEIRNGIIIPSVLILKDNKSYGREKKENKTGKLLYKCIPDDKRIPIFLIPFEIKNMNFSKIFKNNYVLIKFNNWDNKHPYGYLENKIGDIDILNNFYEYQLYCKSLNSSIQKFNKETLKALKDLTKEKIIEKIKLKFPNIEDRTNENEYNVYTIDNKNSNVYDDGFSIKLLGKNDIIDNKLIIHDNEEIYKLSIYISNVSIIIDILNLWDAFSDRVATIYLPDKKRPMLPTILSEALCSLRENSVNIAFTLDLIINNDKIIDYSYKNSLIKVKKNYIYEEKDLIENKSYINLKNILQKLLNLSEISKYIKNLNNSHDVISYLMILINYYSALELLKYKKGVFRGLIKKDNKERHTKIPENIPDKVSNFIILWNSSVGHYINGDDFIDSEHDILKIEAYIHITSPIRRLVDILNMIIFSVVEKENYNITLSSSAIKFYEYWINKLEDINKKMISIKKLQCESSLLDLCINDMTILEKEFDGYLFDKIYRNEYYFQYNVYLPELNMSSRIICNEEYDNYEYKKFKLYIFNNEEKFKRKIRLQIIL